MNPSFKIYNWLVAGSDPQIGVRLFGLLINSCPTILRILESNPASHLHMIKSVLQNYMDAQAESEVFYVSNSEVITPQEIKKNTANDSPKKSLREQFPFLSEIDCPVELKILAADKITAYEKVVYFYNQLSTGATDKDQLHIVSSLVNWYKKNNAIKREFSHYRDKREILGEHSIFTEYKNLQALKQLSALELANMKTKVENNISRTKTEIRKGNREDLRLVREEKLRNYEIQLQEIIKFLK